MILDNFFCKISGVNVPLPNYYAPNAPSCARWTVIYVHVNFRDLAITPGGLVIYMFDVAFEAKICQPQKWKSPRQACRWPPVPREIPQFHGGRPPTTVKLKNSKIATADDRARPRTPGSRPSVKRGRLDDRQKSWRVRHEPTADSFHFVL